MILDGNEMRESISVEGFSREDRHAHNLRVARLAHVLSKQSLVIISVIAPFSQTRAEIDRLISPIWVLCSRRNQKGGPEFPYELPTADEVSVVADGDASPPSENAAKVIEAVQRRIPLR